MASSSPSVAPGFSTATGSCSSSSISSSNSISSTNSSSERSFCPEGSTSSTSSAVGSISSEGAVRFNGFGFYGSFKDKAFGLSVREDFISLIKIFTFTKLGLSNDPLLLLK